MKLTVNVIFLLSLFIIILLFVEDYKKDDISTEKVEDLKYIKDDNFAKRNRADFKENNKEIMSARTNILEILNSTRQSMQAIKDNFSKIHISMPNIITGLDSLNDFLDEFNGKIDDIKNCEGLTGKIIRDEIDLANIETKINKFNALINEVNEIVLMYRKERYNNKRKDEK